MVLLHGLAERARSWDSVRGELATRFRTYAVDLRGHGDSDHAADYTHAAIEDDVCGLLDTLALRDVTLVGHSLGGNVGLRVAAHRPDLVARLVVEDVIPPFPRGRDLPRRPDRVLDFDWAAVPALMGEASTYDERAWAELADIVAPTLLISGGAASHLPSERVADVAALIPGCTQVVIEAGHHVHRRAPDAFVAAVEEWLDR